MLSYIRVMWNEDERKLLNEVKKQCLFGLYLQSRSAYMNHMIYNFLMLPNIVIGGVLSVSIFTTNGGPWKFVGGALALTSTVLTGLVKHTGAAEKAQLHCLVVREYQRLIQDINMYLYTDVANTSEVITNIRKEMDKIISMQPDPSIWMLQRFNNKYRDKFDIMILHDFEKQMMQEATAVQQRVSQQVKISSGINPITRHTSHHLTSIMTEIREDHMLTERR